MSEFSQELQREPSTNHMNTKRWSIHRLTSSPMATHQFLLIFQDKTAECVEVVKSPLSLDFLRNNIKAHHMLRKPTSSAGHQVEETDSKQDFGHLLRLTDYS